MERSNIFDTTIRDRPEEWTAGVWKEVYDFAPGGGGMANRTDLYNEDKFCNEADPKDGYLVRDCRDARERRVLEFLVPIVHSDKPTRVTRTLGNTIFGALSGERSVDWAIIFMELVNRLVGGAGKTKPTPICPFLYHLYESKGLLTEDEETDYKAARELNRYRITPDRDPELESEVRFIVGPEPNRVVVSVNQVRRGNRFKQTYRAPEGSPPTRSRGEGSQPNSGGARPDNPRPMSPPSERPQPKQPEPQQTELLQPEQEGTPWVLKPFDSVVQSYKVVKKQYQAMEKLINSISRYLDTELDIMLDRIKARPTPQDVSDLQARMDCLLKENGELRAKVDEGDAIRKENRELKDRIRAMEEVKTARVERDKSKEVTQKVCGFLGNPGDMLNKARLYDHGLKQPSIDSGVKMMRCMVDYGLRMEKFLKELRVLLHSTGAQPEPVGTPGAGPNTTPAPTSIPEFVTPTTT